MANSIISLYNLHIPLEVDDKIDGVRCGCDGKFAVHYIYQDTRAKIVPTERSISAKEDDAVFTRIAPLVPPPLELPLPLLPDEEVPDPDPDAEESDDGAV